MAVATKSVFESFLESEEMVKEHFLNTPFNTPDSFMGKEHFWKMAIDLGRTVSSASIAFQAIAFPRVQHVKRTKYGPRMEPIDPSLIGLVTATRAELGFPNPPVVITALMGNQATYMTSRHQQALEHTNDDATTLIQVEGFVDLAARLNDFGRVDKLNLRGLGPNGTQSIRAMAALIVDSLE